MVEDVLFHRGAVVDDGFLLVRQIPEGDVGAHPHRPADVGHQRPHEAVPRGYRSLVDGQGVVRHQGGPVHRPDHAGAAAGAAGPLAVEGQFFRAGGVETGPALRAGQRLPGRHGQGRGRIVPVWAAMAGQAGVHQPQVVEQLRPRAERAADSRHAGSLVKRQRGRDVQHLIHICPGRLRHPAARVGGQGLQIPPGALGIQNPQRQGGFSGAGDAGDAYDLI